MQQDKFLSEAILKRIDSKLTNLLNKKKESETWVKASVIIRLTGWTHMQMHHGRVNGYIKYKKDNGIWYLLESINPIFYKKE